MSAKRETEIAVCDTRGMLLLSDYISEQLYITCLFAGDRAGYAAG